MNSVDMTLDFSSNDFDSEQLETLTQAVYIQINDLVEANISRVHETAPVNAKSGDEGKPKSGWLTINIDAFKSSKIFQVLLARLQGTRVKFKVKNQDKELQFETQNFTHQEVEKLLDLLKKL